MLVVVVHRLLDELAHLPLVAEALRGTGGDPRPVQCRHQESGEDGDDADHHEEFDEGESLFLLHFSIPLLRIDNMRFGNSSFHSCYSKCGTVIFQWRNRFFCKK